MGSRLFETFDLIWTECISRVHQQIYFLRNHSDRHQEALEMTRETLERVTESTQSADFNSFDINPLHVFAVKAALREHSLTLPRRSHQKDMVESLQILGHFMQSIRRRGKPSSSPSEQNLRRAMEGIELNDGSERALVTRDLLRAMESMCIYDPA